MGIISVDVKEVTKTKEYTEHTGEIVWMDGEKKELTFDGYKRKDGVVVLSDYIFQEGQEKPKRQAFMTIPMENIRYFKTKKREKKTLEWTEEKKEGEDEGELNYCRYCVKSFGTERGRQIHEAQKHEENTPRRGGFL